jgi:peptide deformylase
VAKESNSFVIGNKYLPEDSILVVDPKIIAISDEKVTLEEVDIYDNNYTVRVKRPKWIRARITMENGEKTTVRYDGLTARFFQQMVDQLNNISSRRRANRFHKEAADRKMRRRNKTL